jgi:hypothetical protein
MKELLLMPSSRPLVGGQAYASPAHPCPPMSPVLGLPMADMVGLYSSEANEEEGQSVPSSSNGPSI